MCLNPFVEILEMFLYLPRNVWMNERGAMDTTERRLYSPPVRSFTSIFLGLISAFLHSLPTWRISPVQGFAGRLTVGQKD